jgi:hypothetical protein
MEKDLAGVTSLCELLLIAQTHTGCEPSGACLAGCSHVAQFQLQRCPTEIVPSGE